MNHLGTPPFICLITQGKATPENYSSNREQILETIRGAVEDGVSLIQIREKHLPARLLSELVADAVGLTRGGAPHLVVNDRADVALAAGADGVHLPERGLSPKIIRQSFPAELVVGVSVHSLDAAILAVRDGADYIFFGPVFETPGKDRPVGLVELKRVCDRLRGFPVIALGGIDENNAADVLEAGAAGIAAIRSLHDRDSRRKILSSVR